VCDLQSVISRFQFCEYSAYFWIGLNRIGGVLVIMLASSAVDRGFEPRSGQTKGYKFGICSSLSLEVMTST
jgi:hypothetical protein